MRLSSLLANLDMSLGIPAPRGAVEDTNELRVSRFVPFTYYYDETTLLTRDYGLATTLHVPGLCFDSLNEHDVRVARQRRNGLWRALAHPHLTLYSHLIRRRVPIATEGTYKEYYPKRLASQWEKRFEGRAAFRNDYYLTLVCQRFRNGIQGAVARRTKSGKVWSSYEEGELVRTLKERVELCARVLEPYGADVLRVHWPHEDVKPGVVDRADIYGLLERYALAPAPFFEAHGDRESYAADDVRDWLGEPYSEQGSFLHYLLNLQDARVTVDDVPLYRSLPRSYIHTSPTDSVIDVEGNTRRRAATMLSMLTWPGKTGARMLDEFLKQPQEFIVTQSFEYQDRATAEAAMHLESKRIKNNTEGLLSDQVEEVQDAIRDVAANRVSMGLHHLSICVHRDAGEAGPISAARGKAIRAELNTAVSQLENSFVNLHVKPVRERLAAETFFWSQLPSQTSFMSRRGTISSKNFAGFASFHNYAIGKARGNLWGPAVAVVETESGTPYFFNFHREQDGVVAGHFAVTGNTGSGKTGVVAFLVSMADKFSPRIFWFDNRQGAAVLGGAFNARHANLSLRASTGWNPCQLEDTERNRNHLLDLLKLMATCHGYELTADDVTRLNEAVVNNFDPSKSRKDRRLRNLAWCFGTGELAKAMSLWHGNGANAGVFDNPEDTFDLSACRHYVFEMQELLTSSGTAARPELPVVLSYPLFRIELAMDGSPFVIVLDEGQNLVKHPYWKAKIENFYMTIRRMNGIVGFITPDPKYLYCETDAILKQTVTLICLPNDAAQREEYVNRIGLTEPEFQFIRDTDPQDRMFLIRRGRDSVRAKLDLSEMPEWIPVLSSNEKGVQLMNECRNELGADASVWLPEFQRRALARRTHNVSKRER